MNKMNGKIPLFSKIALKTAFFVTTPLVISSSCYVPNEVNYDISFEIKDKAAKLSSDITFHNVSDHIKVNKPSYIDLEFTSVTQTNNSLELEYKIINKNKREIQLKKSLLTGFKNYAPGNIIINPKTVPYIDKSQPLNDD